MKHLHRVVHLISAMAPNSGVGAVIKDSIDIGPGNWQIFFKPEATQQQRDAANALVAELDWSEAALIAWESGQVQIEAHASVDATVANSKLLRAFADILKDEFNAIRSWITDYKADVAAATNLTDLKTRVAANPNLPDRTLAQLKTALKDRINSGTAEV